MQGLVAGCEFLLAGSGVVVAALADGFGAGTELGQAGLVGGGTNLAELIPHVLRRPGSLDRVGVAQVQQPPVSLAWM